MYFFFFQAEDGIRDGRVTGVQTCALPILAQSPEDARASTAYERAWNAINELIRSDHTWHGYARNVMFANNGDGTFAEISGPAGLDFPDDCRSFALADVDHDGRLEIVLKSRNAQQIRNMRHRL